MTERPEKVRVLAVVSADMQDEIRRQLISFGMAATLTSGGEDLVRALRDKEAYHVLLMPVSLPKEDDWWAVWGALSLMDVKPAILVYAHTGSFQLWSGVLEAGGYDVIVEPLTDEKLKDALLRAAKSYTGLPNEDEEPWKSSGPLSS